MNKILCGLLAASLACAALAVRAADASAENPAWTEAVEARSELTRGARAELTHP